MDLRVKSNRVDVLKGNFTSHAESDWKYPKSNMMVFVSSPFTDTKVERAVLMNDVLPALREMCQINNIEITLVDMRWGVRDENTADHSTWIECQRAIRMCRDQSCGLFFLSIQGDKSVSVFS
jgi:hypothetical protein